MRGYLTISNYFSSGERFRLDASAESARRPGSRRVRGWARGCALPLGVCGEADFRRLVDDATEVVSEDLVGA
jgi:hypothetical protein